MSKFVRVKTQLRDLAMIKRALDDLKLGYTENTHYRHAWSGFSGEVPLLVRAPKAVFAFRPAADEGYEAVGDDMQMPAIRAALQQVQQRYAYHVVRAETEKAGFELVEETVGRDQAIRLTVRRWA